MRALSLGEPGAGTCIHILHSELEGNCSAFSLGWTNYQTNHNIANNTIISNH